jgi:hypothetical protein
MLNLVVHIVTVGLLRFRIKPHSSGCGTSISLEPQRWPHSVGSTFITDGSYYVEKDTKLVFRMWKQLGS